MLWIISALAAPATNGQVPDDAAPAGAPDASDDGKSPWERYVNGGLYSGVFSIHDASACSKKGAEPLFGSILMPPGSKIGRAEHDAILGGWIQMIRTWHGAFVDAGDMVVRARHTCVGIIDSGKPNATSYYAGYLVFDPRAMLLSLDAPGLKLHRVEAILAHEYAHQLHGSVFRGDRSERRIELAADCMAAGIIAIQGAQNTDAGPVTMYTGSQAASSIGTIARRPAFAIRPHTPRVDHAALSMSASDSTFTQASSTPSVLNQSPPPRRPPRPHPKKRLYDGSGGHRGG